MCFSSPNIPAPLPPPAQNIAQSALDAKEAQRRKAAMAQGLSSTFSNGSGGLLSGAPIMTKSLLGR